MKEGIKKCLHDSTDSINPDRLECLLEKVPCFSEVALKAQQVLDQPEFDIDKLVKVLETDPTLVVRILKLANSSYYGLARKIASLRDACIVLGKHTLRNLIMMAAVLDLLKNHDVDQANYDNYWRHFIHTGVIARDLANRLGMNGDIAYIVGLLHDIGSIFIEVLLPDDALAIREQMEATGNGLEQTELDVLGFDHAEFSGAIARHWNLPEEITLPMKSHHEVKHDSPRLCEVIHVADKISMTMSMPDDEQNISNEIEARVLEHLDLTQVTISEYMQECLAPDDDGITELLQ